MAGLAISVPTQGCLGRVRSKTWKLENLPVSQWPGNGGHPSMKSLLLEHHLSSVKRTSAEESCNEPNCSLTAAHSRRQQFSNFRAISLAFSFLIRFSTSYISIEMSDTLPILLLYSLGK